LTKSVKGRFKKVLSPVSPSSLLNKVLRLFNRDEGDTGDNVTTKIKWTNSVRPELVEGQPFMVRYLTTNGLLYFGRL